MDTTLFFLADAASRFRWLLLGFLALCVLLMLAEKLTVVRVPRHVALSAALICALALAVFLGAMALGSVMGFASDRKLFYLVFELAFASWPLLAVAGIGLAIFAVR